jgi:hypothetical protein
MAAFKALTMHTLFRRRAATASTSLSGRALRTCRRSRYPGHAAGGRMAALVALGLASLAAGVLVYLTDRAASQTLLVPAVAALSGWQLFGLFGGWLPSFVHPLSFSLFSAVLLAPRARWAYGACGCWFIVNAAFEIGQHPQVRGPLVAVLRRGFGQGPVARAFENYFLRGTFDVGDLLAAALGAALAAGLLHRFRLQPENHHAP